MKQSMRAKRMERHHKRQSQHAKLSLVSLMDIFTILVFFLMLNSSDVQVLDNHKSVTLPAATSETPARETLLLMVNTENLILQGQKVADVPAIMQAGGDTIAALLEELEYRKARRQQSRGADSEGELAITIMGDQAVPYALLKRIMATCAAAGYTDLALAVEQIQSAEAASE
ncbi:biopolymer transporter ExbD [Alteromonas sp. ASW11-19]|uniref:Biopolymer transporter ExbD n=1 Tax=Alteromonas salexigens TaxID=2982530 RepID=A0ABT2VSZ2_9ALTE|nr:biopolymer transporter ExbD [Alteromonas salexigens]MCU7556052.1 biopolymer transporter ExbD [Alteromonas salexigens]